MAFEDRGTGTDSSISGNAGLGAETIRKLAVHRPAAIYCCSRTLSKADAMVSEIKESTGVIVMPVQLDLNDLTSVKTAAETILTATSTIDLLFLNAGIAMMSPGVTAQGYEQQFGVNHIGHALFTQMLLPKMLQTATIRPPRSVRIIVLSSEAHPSAPKAGILFEDLKTDMTSTGAQALYGQSKLANVLFAKKLAALYPDIVTVPLHPGVVSTEIVGKANGISFPLSLMVAPFMWLMAVTVSEGTKTQLWAGTAEGVKSGQYYVPLGKESKGSAWANDEKLRDELWGWTNKELEAHGGPGWPAVK